MCINYTMDCENENISCGINKDGKACSKKSVTASFAKRQKMQHLLVSFMYSCDRLPTIIYMSICVVMHLETKYVQFHVLY